VQQLSRCFEISEFGGQDHIDEIVVEWLPGFRHDFTDLKPDRRYLFDRRPGSASVSSTFTLRSVYRETMNLTNAENRLGTACVFGSGARRDGDCGFAERRLGWHLGLAWPEES